MKLVILAEGTLREKYWQAAQEEYLARIRRHLPVEVREVERLRGVAPGIDRVVALDASGRELSSEELARWLERTLNAGGRALTFVIGGPDGLPPAVRARAGDVLSLSKLTLPHRLARIVLLEQLYRALSILRGEPYHR